MVCSGQGTRRERNSCMHGADIKNIKLLSNEKATFSAEEITGLSIVPALGTCLGDTDASCELVLIIIKQNEKSWLLLKSAVFSGYYYKALNEREPLGLT